ncbi:MAG: hypothetical protein ACOYEB_09840 [Enterococcus lemanii]|jgi:hypothetical protein
MKTNTNKGADCYLPTGNIVNISLFTSQPAAAFYDALFCNLKLTVSASKTGRKGFSKEATFSAFVVMKFEGFTQTADLAVYLDNNRLDAHYCGFSIMEPLPSYWSNDCIMKAQASNTPNCDKMKNQER